jgi:AbiV family abortive infection protein
MNEEDAYREAMKESIKNAEQCLKDARLLARHGSHTHSFVLRDLAGEEIAKAFACWQVLVGALPSNHPLVRPNIEENTETILERLKNEAERDRRRVREGKPPKKQISVFMSHAMKYALSSDLATQFFIPEESRKEMTPEAEVFLGSLNQVMGEIGVLKRSEWLYVNLSKTEEGLKVTSPMKTELGAFDPDFPINQKSLEVIKKLVSTPSPEFSRWVERRRESLKRLDPYFPKDPKWITDKKKEKSEV